MTAAIATTAVMVVALLFAERASSPRGVASTKPLASLGFIAVAYMGGALETSYGQAVLVGLVACALGDVLLIPRGAGAAFLGGMASFALGHAAYAYAFMQRGTAPIAALVALAVMIAVAVVTLRWLGPGLPPDMRIPIRIYITIISAMVVLAIGASFAVANPWLATGAVLFAISDLAVARERFVQAELTNQLWGLPLYYTAQVIIASTAGQGG